MSANIKAVIFIVIGAALLASGPVGCSRSSSSTDDQGKVARQQSAAVSDSDRQILTAAKAALEDKNVDQAQILLRPLALRNLAEAQTLLGISYANDLSLLDPSAGGARAKEAQYWLIKAAEQGDAPGQAYLGLLMLHWSEKLGLKPEDEREALDWLEKAASRGEVGAMAFLILTYSNDEQYRDIGKAEYWQAEMDKASPRSTPSKESIDTPDAEARAVASPVMAEAAVVEHATARAAPIAAATQPTAAPDQTSAPQPAATATVIRDASESARARQLANAVITQSNDHLTHANAAVAGVTADDPRSVLLDSGKRGITFDDGTWLVYGADGRLSEVRLPEDVILAYDKIGDVHVISATGKVHYLANGRVCHVNMPGLQVRYGPDGSSTVFQVSGEG